MEKAACIIVAMLMTMTAIAIIGNTDKTSYRPMGNTSTTIQKVTSR